MTAPKVSAAKLREKSADYAKKVVEKAFAESSISDNAGSFPKFSFSELTIGKVLGKGGFGTVSEVRAFAHEGASSNKGSQRSLSRRDLSETEVDTGEMESRAFIAEHCIRNGGDARYAVKVLSPEVIADPARYLQGIIDMAVETRFLSYVEHPNIIKMRAIAQVDPFHEEYFIVMDRLYDTLEKRLKQWETRDKRTQGLGKLLDRKGSKKAELHEERIVAAFDLAAAIQYLHQTNIVYRDIKPENIGFDIRGDIKIFDFGLAKELKQSAYNKDGTYNLTGMTGSPRYMAPEVANGEPYNASCDVYSFAILLWELMALKRPYELYTPKSLRAKVYNGEHKRPPVNEAWPNAIKICLKRSWCKNLHERNSMEQIVKILRKECVSARNGDESGLEHNRRRSTFVFRPSGSKRGGMLKAH